jgi:hypothetical protein
VPRSTRGPVYNQILKFSYASLISDETSSRQHQSFSRWRIQASQWNLVHEYKVTNQYNARGDCASIRVRVRVKVRIFMKWDAELRLSGDKRLMRFIEQSSPFVDWRWMNWMPHLWYSTCYLQYSMVRFNWIIFCKMWMAECLVAVFLACLWLYWLCLTFCVYFFCAWRRHCTHIKMPMSLPQVWNCGRTPVAVCIKCYVSCNTTLRRHKVNTVWQLRGNTV